MHITFNYRVTRWFSGNFPEISRKCSGNFSEIFRHPPSPLTPPPPGPSNPFFSIMCFPQIPRFPPRRSNMIHGSLISKWSYNCSMVGCVTFIRKSTNLFDFINQSNLQFFQFWKNMVKSTSFHQVRFWFRCVFEDSSWIVLIFLWTN